MKFSELYLDTLKFWTIEILIEDGQDVEGSWGDFKTLSRIWDSVEQATESESEEIKIMVWAIFAGFHKAATREFIKGVKAINSSHINLAYVAHKFEESLYDSENKNFGSVQSSYINDLKDKI